ncbi:MAG: PAS domain-containing protein, partial [Pseudomonadota bacterium]
MAQNTAYSATATMETEATTSLHSTGTLRLLERPNALLKLTGLVYWESDADLCFSYFECADQEFAAHLFQVYAGRHILNLPVSIEPPDSSGDFRGLLELRQPFEKLILHHVSNTGQEYHFRLSGMPVFAGNRRFCGYQGTSEDITRQRLAEMRAQRVTSMYSALARTNEVILRAQAEPELFDQLAEETTQQGGFLSTAIF